VSDRTITSFIWQLSHPSQWAWALLPSAASAALYVLRTGLEDRTLQAELPGYAEYARQTRYRLLPGVWEPRGEEI